MNRNEHRYDTVELPSARHGQPEERKPRGRFRNHRIPKWVYRIILILLACVLAMLAWFNRQNLTPANVAEWVRERVVGMGVGDGFPYSISGSSISKMNFVSSDKNLIFASDTSLTELNSTALELMNRQHSFSNPVLSVRGTRVLLYNLGGKGCEIDTVGRTIAKFSAPGNILGGAVSTDGSYALITEAEGYCGLLTAYTSGGQVRSRYWFSDYYPSSVALSPDGMRAAVTGVSTRNGELVSAVYLIDLNDATPVSPFAEFSDNMLFAVNWDANTSVVTAVGDRAAVTVHPDKRTKSEYSYDGKQLTACCFDSGRTVLGLASFEGSDASRLVVLDATGNPVCNISLEKTVESVSLYGQSVAALSGGKIFFYHPSSGASGLQSAQAGTNARAVALKDESTAYVLGVSEIRLVGVK